MAKKLLEEEETGVVTGQDIVNSARKLLGAPYRTWYPGALLPMWLADGMGNPPSSGVDKT
jgi:hypothetical protein